MDGRGDDIVEFDLRYSDDEREGVVNVWGVRGQGTSLILLVVIAESPKRRSVVTER
jgi:hypothetical protein